LTVPGRTFDVVDVLANAAAAALAVVGWRLLVRCVRFYRVRRLAEVRSPVE
jgi:VanZ family protein